VVSVDRPHDPGRPVQHPYEASGINLGVENLFTVPLELLHLVDAEWILVVVQFEPVALNPIRHIVAVDSGFSKIPVQNNFIGHYVAGIIEEICSKDH